MTEKKVGRPTILPEMMTEEMTEQILEKVAEGCYDIEIYKALHVSAATFRKWRDANIEAYDKAKALARSNMLSAAESAIMSKLQPRTLSETETIYEADGKVKSVKVKEKQLDSDSLIAMFVAKAANPELWNPSEYRRLQLEEKSGNDLKDAIDKITTYDVNKYQAPEITIPEGYDDEISE